RARRVRRRRGGAREPPLAPHRGRAGGGGGGPARRLRAARRRRGARPRARARSALRAEAAPLLRVHARVRGGEGGVRRALLVAAALFGAGCAEPSAAGAPIDVGVSVLRISLPVFVAEREGL